MLPMQNLAKCLETFKRAVGAFLRCTASEHRLDALYDVLEKYEALTRLVLNSDDVCVRIRAVAQKTGMMVANNLCEVETYYECLFVLLMHVLVGECDEKACQTFQDVAETIFFVGKIPARVLSVQWLTRAAVLGRYAALYDASPFMTGLLERLSDVLMHVGTRHYARNPGPDAIRLVSAMTRLTPWPRAPGDDERCMLARADLWNRTQYLARQPIEFWTLNLGALSMSVEAGGAGVWAELAPAVRGVCAAFRGVSLSRAHCTFDAMIGALEMFARLDALRRRASRQSRKKKTRAQSLRGGECVICMARPSRVAAVPCGHFCVCIECSRAVAHAARGCPVCRADVGKFVPLR